MWVKEIPDTYCTNNIYKEEIHEQLACQKFCEMELDYGCVGIAFPQTEKPHCFLCPDDTLSKSRLNYSFYRRPLGNNKMYSKCKTCFNKVSIRNNILYTLMLNIKVLCYKIPL